MSQKYRDKKKRDTTSGGNRELGVPSHVVLPKGRPKRSQSESSEKEKEKGKDKETVRMSDLKSQDLKDYQKEPAAVGASSMRFREEAKKLKEENYQLTERMKEMNAKMKKLETANKSLSESVEQSEEEKGQLSCQVEELKAQLQVSASSQPKTAAKDVAMTDTDDGEDDETFHSLAKEGTDSTDRPPLPAAGVSSSVPYKDLQSLGRLAEKQHTDNHRKENELTAEAVKTQETFPQEENPPPTRKQAGPEETPTSDERESEMLREVEDRARQLEAELNVMREEKEDFKRQMAEVRGKCEETKQKVLADAEKDKNLLVEESEHFRIQSESLESLLQERNGTIQKLTEELRVVKGLHEASSDSTNLSSCTLEKKESDQLKAATNALEESRELERKARQELTESMQERVRQEEMVRRLKQQHQEEVDELKAKVKSAEDTERRCKANSQAILAQKEVEVKHSKEKLGDALQEVGTLQELTERMQQMQKERKSREEMVRRLKQQHQKEVDELKAKVRSAEDTERRWKANNQAVLVRKEAEVKHSKEKLDNALQEIGTLQATADGLQSQITTLQAALAGAREENVARTEHEAKLTSQFQADIASRDANIKQLEERCEQLEAQATTYKLDFEQERSDREEAMGRFETEREVFEGDRELFMADMAKLNEKLAAKHLELDDALGKLEQLKELSVAQKEKLKEKEELLQQTRGACTGLEQKLSKLNTQHETLANENAALRAQLKNWEKDMKAFKAIEGAYQKTFEEAKTYKAYKELYHDAESKRAAADSRVKELTMVVNAIEAKGHGNAGESVEALREENQRLKTQFNALEAACKRVTTEKQQLAFDYQDLKRENEALKGQRVMATAPEMSLAARSAQNGQFRSLQGSMGAVGPLPKGGNGGGGDVFGAPFAGEFVERDSPPSSNFERTGPSSCERISLHPTPLPRTSHHEGVYMNAGRGRHAGSDAPLPKGYPPMPTGYPPVRYPPQAVVGMSHAMAQSPMQQPIAEDRKVPPVQAHMYAPSGPPGKFPTDPYVQRQESSVSASTEGSLPMPLTRPGAVTPLDDSLLSGFEANQRYIGEGINSEIKHEAHRYKKSDKAVVAVPAQANDEEWPLDPNLTCPYCNVVFRRGQMREYRYHVDECQQ